jgi:hypothetical protein
MKATTAQKDEVCASCGYPFDVHQQAYLANNRDIVCSRACGYRLKDWNCPSCGRDDCPGCQPRQILSQFV